MVNFCRAKPCLKLIITNYDGDDYGKGRIQKYIHPECVLNHYVVFVLRFRGLSSQVSVLSSASHWDTEPLQVSLNRE